MIFKMKDFKSMQLKLFDDSGFVIGKTEVSTSLKNKKKHEDPFHLEWLEGMTFTDFGMPLVNPYNDALPESLIPFHEARACYRKSASMTSFPQFFINDIFFLCVLHNLPKYTPMFTRFPAIIGPDLSIKMDMPTHMKIHNAYLNKVATRYYQLHGLKVIPNIVWADPRGYDYCFAGFPTNSVVAVNSMGIIGNSRSVFFWQKGYGEMLKRIHPTHILRYGDKIDGEDESISTYYPNNHLNRMRYGR